jgi:hypothetical protein
MTRQVVLQDFLTEDEISKAISMWKFDNSSGYARRVCDVIIRPNMSRINKALGQENDPMYLAYALEFAMGQVKEPK